MPDKKKILFLCVENAGRSQMAEGFFRKYRPSGYESQSAGTKPTNAINPLAVEAMKEIGIDISTQRPKTISDYTIQQAVKIINMGCMDKDSCPALSMKNALDWQIPDPKGKTLDEIRKIRDQIEQKVKELISSLAEE
jgi:protein-tyrosine-phosphatase